jgi:C_GCAxxG_C_C family probable redox protein
VNVDALRGMDRTRLLEAAEKIHAGYVEGLNCAERVFCTVHALVETAIPREAVRLLSGLGGGVGGSRDGVCGAVSGAVAALGLVYGRPNPPEGNREHAYEVSRDFVSQFRTAFGSTVCRDLVGDLLREATPEAETRRKARCSQYTLKAVRMCLDTLARYAPADRS